MGLDFGNSQKGREPANSRAPDDGPVLAAALSPPRGGVPAFRRGAEAPEMQIKKGESL